MPRLIFRHSSLYDERLKRAPDFIMPEEAVFDAKVKEFEAAWSEWGEQLLGEIAAVSRLEWHQKEIVCYVTAGIVAYSDPLTLNLRNTIDTVTHELIHRIWTEPENRAAWNHVYAQLKTYYENESWTTKIHILVHAIHAVILKKLFGQERYEAEKKGMRSNDYVRAWEIVDEYGPEAILDKLLKA